MVVLSLIDMDILSFNPRRDLMEVDQIGFLNLNEAFASGSVSGDFAVTSSDAFNEASPDSLMHRPKDIFEGMRQRDYVKSAVSAANQSQAD